jgi:hypothetical protein
MTTARKIKLKDMHVIIAAGCEVARSIYARLIDVALLRRSLVAVALRLRPPIADCPAAMRKVHVTDPPISRASTRLSWHSLDSNF